MSDEVLCIELDDCRNDADYYLMVEVTGQQSLGFVIGDHNVVLDLVSLYKLQEMVSGVLRQWLQPLARPILLDEGKKELLKAAHALAFHPNGKRRAQIIHILMMENATLTMECNDHRAARGFKPLLIHDVKLK